MHATFEKPDLPPGWRWVENTALSTVSVADAHGRMRARATHRGLNDWHVTVVGTGLVAASKPNKADAMAFIAGCIARMVDNTPEGDANTDLLKVEAAFDEHMDASFAVTTLLAKGLLAQPAMSAHTVWTTAPRQAPEPQEAYVVTGFTTEALWSDLRAALDRDTKARRIHASVPAMIAAEDRAEILHALATPGATGKAA